MDVLGDDKRSARTIALVHGKKYALLVSSFLFVLFSILCLTKNKSFSILKPPIIFD